MIRALPLVLLAVLALLVAGLLAPGGQAFFSGQASVAANTFTSLDCFPNDTGLVSPAAQTVSGGDGDGFEITPTDAFADDAAFAANYDGDGERHRYYDYGISIAADCSIQGIEVRLDWWLDDPSGTNSMRVELSWDAGASWTSYYADSVETTSEHSVTLGGPADGWGRTWSPGELSDANFMLRVTSHCSGAPANCDPRDYFLDWVPVKVYFGY